MSKTLALPNTLYKSQAARKIEKRAVKKTKKGIFSFLTLVVMMLNAYLLVNYMTKINLYSSKGYEIKKLQQKVASLDETGKKLSKQVAENASMLKIQDDFLNSNFVAAGTARFVETSKFTLK
jgi:cell division protein FtsL